MPHTLHRKVSYIYIPIFLQSFGQLAHLPLIVDLTVEENARLKVLYGSREGFHAIDLDSASIYDVYIPQNVRVYMTFAVPDIVLANRQESSHRCFRLTAR